MGSSGLGERRQRSPIRQRIRAPLRLAVAAEPNQTGGHPVPLGRDREPARGGEIERRGVAPHFADDERQRGASQALLHRPQRGAGVARLDVDEVGEGQAPAG